MQYEVYLINLDPTFGHEISKVRPGVVISPDEMNESLGTVIIAPLTSVSKPYPTRVPSRVQGRDGWVVLDQIRTVDKRRVGRYWGRLSTQTMQRVDKAIEISLGLVPI